MMKLGFIGFGEAASAIAKGLYGEGVRGILACDAMAHDRVLGPVIAARAEETHVSLRETAEEVARNADIIISCTQAKYCLDAFHSVKPFLRKGQIYVDVSACSPKLMEQAAAEIEETGALFADVAMMNSVPKHLHKVPMLACGSGAEAFSGMMSPYHMDIEVIAKEAGKASAVKLIRASIIKGTGALIFQTLIAAEKYGIGQQVLESACATNDSYENFLERVNDTVKAAKHAERKIQELSDCADLIDEVGGDSAMTRAAAKVMEYVASFHFKEKHAGGVPEDPMDIIREMC